MAEELILARLDQIQRIITVGAKEVLNVDDVAVITGLSKSRIYHLTAAREIPYYKPSGRGIYFKKSEIENWLLQNKQHSLSETDAMAQTYLSTK